MPSSVVIGLQALCGLIMAITVMGNLLVLTAFALKPSIRRIRSNTFILSLALTDLLMGCIVMPLSIGNKFGQEWNNGEGLCYIWIVSDTVAATASIWNLVAIAADRLIAVVFPIFYMNLGKMSACLTILAMWVLSAAIGLPVLSVIAIKPYEYCTFDGSTWFMALSSIGAFYVPFGLITICYGLIINQLKRRMDKKRASRIEQIELQAVHSDREKQQRQRFNKENGSDFWTKCTQGCCINETSKDSEKTQTVIQGEGYCNSRKTSSTHLSPESPVSNRSPIGSPPESPAPHVVVSSQRSSTTFPPQRLSVTSICEPVEVKNCEEKRLKRNESTATTAKPLKPKRPTLVQSSSTVAMTAKRERRVLLQMSVLVAAFLICWLPFWILLTIVNEVCFPYEQDCPVGRYLPYADQVTQWFGYANSLINPFLYTTFNTQFRSAFRDILTGKIFKKH